MTRGEAIKQFLWKSILPAAAATLLVCIFKSACMKDLPPGMNQKNIRCRPKGRPHKIHSHT